MLENASTMPTMPRDDAVIALASIRFRERVLLVVAGLFLLVIFAGLIAAQGRSVLDFWSFGVWVVCAVLGHLALRRYLPYHDPFLFPVVMLLSGWGVALTARLAPDFGARQTAWLAISTGALVAIVAMPGHLRWLSRYRYLWMGAGLILLGMTIILGTNPSGGGPRLWLGILDIYFQPAELLKVLLVVFLASYLADNRALLDINTPYIGQARPAARSVFALRFLAPLILMWGLCIVVLLWQQDLGMATLFFVIFLTMLYVASGQVRYVLEGAIMLILAGIVAYHFFAVVRLRVDVWLNPWPEADNRAFQIVQSLLAFSAGGVFGQGIAQGSPTYIPVVHSDFVFAAIAEEWGLLGTLTVLACLALIVMRGLRVAVRTATNRPFRSFLAAGLSVTLATQCLIIMGGVLKLIPLTGITLPFLSYGGSSLLANFIMIGLLIVLSGDP